MSKEVKKVCCLCGKEFEGWGNNAWPLAEGICCDSCNRNKILPARLENLYSHKK